jgi:hypothetical protein
MFPPNLPRRSMARRRPIISYLSAQPVLEIESTIQIKKIKGYSMRYFEVFARLRQHLSPSLSQRYHYYTSKMDTRTINKRHYNFVRKYDCEQALHHDSPEISMWLVALAVPPWMLFYISRLMIKLWTRET